MEFELLPLIEKFGLPVFYLVITLLALKQLYNDAKLERKEFTAIIKEFSIKFDDISCLKGKNEKV